MTDDREKDLTYAERRNLRKQWYVYNHALGYAEHKWFIQVRYSHRQRLSEHLHNKARRDNPIDTALLPWQ
jgi:hypothetical protein